MSAPPTVAFDATLWKSDFAARVLSLFASVEKTMRSSPPPPSSMAFEIEARLGQYQADRFEPGVTKKLYDKMLGFFTTNSKVSSKFTETYDFTFTQTGNRVTIEVPQEGEDLRPRVSEVMRKEKLTAFPPIDVFVQGDSEYRLRIALGLEHTLPLDGEDTKQERESALRDVKNMLQPHAIKQCMQKLNIGTPMLINGQMNEELQGLEWVMIRRPDGNEEDYTMDTLVYMGNLPTGSKRPHGGSAELSPAAAFEYQIHAKFSQLEDIPSEASKRARFDDDQFDLTSEAFVRHKKRWKIRFADKHFVLDFTETTQPGSVQEPKYELELERCLVAGQLIESSVREARKFMFGVTDLFFQRSRAKCGFDWDDKMVWEALKTRVQARTISFAAAAPALVKQEVSQAESFYNQLERDQGQRHMSIIFHMRCFNNFVKSVLIGKYLPRSKQYRVLELACGKGADLNKLKIAIGREAKLDYLGTDIAKQSLEQGIDRLQGRIPENHTYQFVSADLSQCDLRTPQWLQGGDMLDAWDSHTQQWTKTHSVGGSVQGRINFATMQFAFHYMCKSKSCLNQFLRGVSAMLEPNANFVVTTVDCDAMLEELALSPQASTVAIRDSQNRLLCQVDFPPDTMHRMFNTSDVTMEEDGFQYQFKLFDGSSEDERAVDAPEYLVVMPLLRQLAEEHGLEIVERKRLGQFAVDMLKENPAANVGLWERMNVPNWRGTMSHVEWRIANLYQVLVFRKVDPFRACYLECSNMVEGWGDMPEGLRVARVAQILNARNATK